MASYSEANDPASAVVASPAAAHQPVEYKQVQRLALEDAQYRQDQDHHHHYEHEQRHKQECSPHLAHSPPSHTSDSTTTVTTTVSSSSSSSAVAYDDSTLTSSVPATTVAHHGLQALQAATAGPLSPVTSNDLAQQYAQSAALLQLGESQFSAPLANPLANPAVTSPATSVLGGPHSSQKVTRLRRACDMCSQRKVKCDESGPPCKPCSDLQVECTFRREMKRRGPPNKHAEAARAAKRHQVNQGSPIPQNAAEGLAPIATADGPVALDAEAIAPLPVLILLIDDFFTYIHPIMPFPHEPSFRQAFANRADRTDRDFLALLASMVGVLVASFPRSARAQLKAQTSISGFPTAITLIDHCRSIALEARGSNFMTKQDMSVDDAATSYFLGQAANYTLQWKLGRRFFAETMSFCKELVAHQPRDMAGHLSDPGAAFEAVSQAAKPIDHIKDQIGKRIFWVMVATVRSMSQFGASINELPLPPPTTQEPYPAQPVEVDDEHIFSNQILAQPEGSISLITGFNRNIRIYLTMNELIGVEMCYGISFFDWSAQKNIIGNGLVSTKQTIEDLPPQLQIGKVDPEHNDLAELDQAVFTYCPPAFSTEQPENDVRRALARQPLRRRQLQCEIQKANLHASQIATRSYFVERYLRLRDAHIENAQGGKDEKDEMVAEERESIIRDLFAVLTSVSQRSLEPIGQSTISKFRLVASTLVQGAAEHKGPVAVKAEEHLHRFIDVLAKLEKSGTIAVVGTGTHTMGPQDEDEELRNWAGLRECQMQVISSGGFLCGGV